MSSLPSSELVLNADGSIYHLHLQPEQIADTIITVGDPDRVAMVSRYFDKIEHRVQKREFITHTGMLGKQRLTVISTGIGTDNIDIVLNELDALVNIDLERRELKTERRQLQFIRVGTTGSIQPQLAVGTNIVSACTIGMDNLLHFYPYRPAARAAALQRAFQEQFPAVPVPIYAGAADPDLLRRLSGDWPQGITVSFPGFYAPQGRSLRLESRMSPSLLDSLAQFRFADLSITNFEMETSALFCLAELLGHRAVSCNVVLANRSTGAFSEDSSGDVDQLIRSVLDKLSTG